MKALTVFQIYEGTGEWFDLSKKPIERASFNFGKVEIKREGYFVTEYCIGWPIFTCQMAKRQTFTLSDINSVLEALKRCWALE